MKFISPSIIYLKLTTNPKAKPKTITDRETTLHGPEVLPMYPLCYHARKKKCWSLTSGQAQQTDLVISIHPGRHSSGYSFIHQLTQWQTHTDRPKHTISVSVMEAFSVQTKTNVLYHLSHSKKYFHNVLLCFSHFNAYSFLRCLAHNYVPFTINNKNKNVTSLALHIKSN